MKKIFLLLFAVFLVFPCLAKNLYVLELKIYRKDNFSFNIVNEHNAVELKLPVDKDLFYSVKKGDVLQENDVYKSAFSIFPAFFRFFRITVVNKEVKKIDNSPETAESKLYVLRLVSQKRDAFSFNLRNRRNAIVFEIPVDKSFYASLKTGENLAKQNVYEGAFDLIPELFSEIKVTVDGKRVVQKKGGK